MTHEQLREVAAAYALGALDADECLALEAHVSECADCRAEVDAHREVAAMLAFAAPLPPVDRDRVAALRSRIVEDAAKGRPSIVVRPTPVTPVRVSRPVGNISTWLAAASMLLAVISSAAWLKTRRDEVALRQALDRTSQTLAARDSVLANFFGPMVHVVSLSEGENQKPQARVFWNHTKKTFIITAFNVPPAPKGKTYQLWAIRNGQAPLSMGTFDTDASGRALAIVPVGDIADAGFIDNCAMTLEPVGGSKQPTETPRLIGAWRHVD